MTEIDLDALAALYANEPESGTVWLDKATLSALIDRIEALEAERDTAQSLYAQQTRLSTAARQRADRAEARLARVTDESRAESIAEQVEREMDAEVHDDLCACDRFPNGCVTYGDRIPWTHFFSESVVLAAIRAVAADEQPEHVHDGDTFAAGVCCGAPHCKAAPHIEGCYATDPDERDDRPIAADEQEASDG